LSGRVPATPLAALFLDLDGFKPLNDRYGHDTGDQVLVVVAKRLRAAVREADLCVRLGGDEFVVLLEGDIAPASLERIAHKLHRSITAPLRIGQRVLRVGVSIGGAIAAGDAAAAARGSAHGALLEAADAAMYRAKLNGMPYCFDAACQNAA